MILHRHAPTVTQRHIAAEFGKGNLPDNFKPVFSEGYEAICKCGARFIVHDQPQRFAEPITELQEAV